MNQIKNFEYSQKNLDKTEILIRWIPKLLRGIYRTVLTWKDQNMGRMVEVKYMNEPCNAC